MQNNILKLCGIFNVIPNSYKRKTAMLQEMFGNDEKRNLRRNIGGLRWAENSNRIILIIIGFQSGLRVVTGFPHAVKCVYNNRSQSQLKDNEWRDSN